MKIRSFIYSMLTGVAVFTLSACADSVGEFFGLGDGDPINFTVTAEEEVQDLTRAAIEEDSRVTVFRNTESKKPLLLSSSVTQRETDTEATRGHRLSSADELTTFRVSAAIGSKNISEDAFDNLKPEYFYNVKAEKNSSDIFEISRDYYWPSSDDKLWFYAYTPCDDSNVLISDQTEGGPQKVSFTVATNVAEQIDLMTADASTTAFTSAAGDITKTAVPLNFRHELTAIRFVIGEQWLAGSIKSIGIYNVHGRGTMTIGDNDATKWEWKNKAGNTVNAVDDFVYTVDKGGLEGNDGEEFLEPDFYFLMIPQSFDDNNDAYVEVKYQDDAREYVVTAPLKGQSAWVRNTTVTYAISSHELTKLKVGTIYWPTSSAEDAWNGPKIDFVAGDAVGLYVVDPDGLTIQPHHQNVRCSFDGGHWTVHHPEGNPVYKRPGYQYFFYYPYTPTPSTIYPVAGQNNTNTTATAFFSHLINGWTPAAVQNTSLATLNAQDLQVAKGVDDEQQKSMVNATMAHQMNLAKLKLGGSSVTDTWIYPIDNGAYTWNYVPDKRDVMASDKFSVNFPYLYSDAHYYYVFKPVEANTDKGVELKALNAQGTATDWLWELKSLERGKLITHTAISADEGKNVMHNNELTVAQISPLTATGSALTVSVNVTVNTTALTKGTDYTVSYKNSANEAVTTISTAGTYTALFAPKGRYSGDVVPRTFTVNKAGKGISFASSSIVKTYGDAAFTQAVTNTGTGTVTYSSGNTNVATVNASSGQVTIKAAGTAVITATVQDNEYYTYPTKTATYTLTVNKAASSVSKAPTAKSLTYNGSAQALVNAGTPSGGTMQYKLSTSSTWSTSIPTATNAGSYTVNYKVVGDANHNDNSGGSVAVTINKAASSVSKAPTAKSLTFNGSAQALVNAGTPSGGTMQYKLNSGSWSTTIPTATNAGSYTVYYKVVGDANHNDNSGSSVAVTINRKALGANSSSFKYTTTSVTKTYLWELNGYTNSTLTIPSGCTVTYSSSNTGVATVNGSGTLSAGTTANTNTTITATLATGNYTGTATYTIKGTNKVLTYNYTGGSQTVTLPKGKWIFECWGAAAGNLPCYGAYTKGTIALTAQTTFYVYCGQAGCRGNGTYGVRFNGGGGYSAQGDNNHGSGGGATDFRTVSGAWNNFNSLKSRIMVAGGGGGGATGCYDPGHGGTTTSPTAWAGQPDSPHVGGAGQTYGYSFGTGQSNNRAGGGGGYYGGYATDHCGSGGSSYISGHSGCNSISSGSTASSISHTGSANHYSGYKFTSTTMTAGVNNGNGYAKVTWAGN